MAGTGGTELAEITMPSGEKIFIQIAADPDEITDSAFLGLGREKVLGPLQRLDETIRGVVRSVGASVARHSPARTELEFGIEISGGTGHALAVLANAHATATVKVKMTWEHGQFPQVASRVDNDRGEEDEEDEGNEENEEQGAEGIEGNQGTDNAEDTATGK